MNDTDYDPPATPTSSTSSSGVMFRSYTHARRFPLVIGNIQGFKLRVPWTPVQLLVTVTAFVVFAVTRGVWARFGVLVDTIVLLGVPMLLGTLTRRLRVEGRPPWRFAVGWLSWQSQRWSRPPPARAVRVRATTVVEVTDR